MLSTHYKTIAHLSSNRDLKYLLRDYFSLPKSQALMPALLARGLGQADLVLSLLHIRDAHLTLRPSAEDFIAKFIGHPIVIGPGCLLRYRTNGMPTATLDASPRITYVAPDNPRQPNTDAHLRWCEYKVGRSVAQLRSRGVTPRDIRRAVARGWIRIEERA